MVRFGKSIECFKIFIVCICDHVFGKCWCRRCFVPVDGNKVITKILLVEALLGSPGLIGRFRPEPKLEFCIRNDDSFFIGKISTLAVDFKTERSDLIGKMFSNFFDGLVKIYVNIMNLC